MKDLLEIPAIFKIADKLILLKTFLAIFMSLVHKETQLLDKIKTKKNFNIAKSIPSSLFLSLIIMLFLYNWFWGETNGDDLYRVKLVIAILGVATIVLLALSERWNIRPLAK